MDREDLDPMDRAFLHILQAAAKGHDEVWAGAAKLAEKARRSVRWVQLRLKRYASMGLIATVRDYSLVTRRRIVLLWRKPTPQPEPAPQPTEGAMRDDLRLVRRPSVPAAAPPTLAEAAPPVPPRGGEPEARKATAEEVAELMAAAAKVEGSTPEKARMLAKLYTLTVVLAAAKRAAAKGMGWGWVVQTSKAWAAEGVPDYARPDAPHERSQAESLAALFGPGGKYAEPEIDLTPYLGIRLHDS